MILFTLAFVAKISTTTVTLPVGFLADTATTSMLDTELHLLSDYYGNDYDKAKAVIQCESGGNIKALNASDPNGSRGIAQFQNTTFYPYANLLGIENSDVWNPYQQIEVLEYLWSIGQQHRWSCYNKLYGK